MKPLCTIAVVVWLCAAADPAGRIIGEVTARTPDGWTVRADQGRIVTVTAAPGTVFLRVPPGEQDLKKAARIGAADVNSGDRVLARGALSPDGNSLAASSVVVITKSDLAEKQQREREDWRKRGVAGRVTAVDTEKKEITLAVLAREASTNLTVDAGANPEFRRYAPDSARFADARPSSLAEIRVGDQVRALGDRQGDRVRAERIVSGSFRNIAGTVLAVDAARGELRLRDLDAKKPVTVRIGADAMLRRLPPMVAAMLARRFNPNATAAPAGPPRQFTRAANPEGRGLGDPHEMLERMPPLALSELKPGDAVLVAATQNADALTLLAGVEPILTAPGGASRLGGMWNFGDIVLPQ